MKNELEKSDFDKEKMENMYNEMHSSLGDSKKEGHGMFRKTFIKVRTKILFFIVTSTLTFITVQAI